MPGMVETERFFSVKGETPMCSEIRVCICRAVGNPFRLGGGLKARAEGPRKFLNLESLKCHFLDFGEDLTESLWSQNSVLVCRNLQFSSTK